MKAGMKKVCRGDRQRVFKKVVCMVKILSAYLCEIPESAGHVVMQCLICTGLASRKEKGRNGKVADENVWLSEEFPMELAHSESFWMLMNRRCTTTLS